MLNKRDNVDQSIAVVEDIPNKETADERQRRLKTARELVKIAAPLDKQLGARLVELLSRDSKQTDARERLSNADGLFDAAVALVNVDPFRAYQLGLSALRVGPSTKVTELIFALRRIDSKFADTLLKEALLVARQTLDPEFLHQMTGVTFPSLKWGLNVPDAPQDLVLFRVIWWIAESKDAMGLSRGSSRSQLPSDSRNTFRCHGLVPWFFTFAATIRH